MTFQEKFPNSYNFYTVGTHDGVFHADEVFAIAFLKWIGYDFRVIRTREKEILSQCDILIDVGGVHDPENGKFDHHQDRNLQKSAFGLLVDALRDELADGPYKHFRQFVEGIDIMDTNPMSVTPASHKGVRSLQQVISGFNRVGESHQKLNFEKAVGFAALILENEWRNAVELEFVEVGYDHRTVLANGVAVCDRFIPNWKERGDHQFMVLPYTTPGQWQLVSADTTKAVVPEGVKDIPGFIFRHGSGFMATFENKEAAIEAAESIQCKLMYAAETLFGMGHWKESKEEAIKEANARYDFADSADSTSYERDIKIHIKQF